MTEAVKVIVRCRPFVSKESKMGCANIVHIEKPMNQISITKPGD